MHIFRGCSAKTSGISSKRMVAKSCFPVQLFSSGILMRTAVKKTVFLGLSVSVLLASTSLTHAGFIWLAPDGQTTESTAAAPYAAKPAPAAEASDRNWAVAETVPAIPPAAATPAQPASVVPAPQTLVAPPEAVMSPAPMAAPVAAPVAAPEAVTSVVPPAADMAAPAADVPAAAAIAAPKVLLSNETMAAEPIYGKGEKKPEKLVELAAPAVEPAPVVATEPAPALAAPMAAEAQIIPAPAPAPAVEQPLVAASQADARVAVEAPAVTANVGMPNAQRMIDAMPSAVVQAPTPTPAPAPVATAAPVPAPMVEAPVATAPVEPVVLSPRVDAAPAAPQPVAEPEAVLASASVVPTAPEPASAAVAPVSLITGDSFGADGAAAPAPAVEPAVVSAPAPAPAAEVAAPVAAASAPAAEPAAPVVQGFGTRVPLVIALRQILPSGYSFAHGDGVDLGASVDWKGGKPWNDVLNDTLSAAGLKASVTGETVFIQKADAAAPAAAVVPATSAAPAAGGAKAVLGGGSMIQSLDPAAR